MMNSRRKFLKVIVAVGAGLGLVSTGKANSLLPPKEKIKMLTPDGKMVEVGKSAGTQSVNRKPASNKEVFEWMNTNKLNS